MANDEVFFKRKGLKILLSAALMMAAFVAQGQVPRGQMRIRTYEINGIIWKYGVQGDQAIITSGDSSIPVIPPETKGKVKIPNDIDGFRVKRVDSFAFVGCRFLREIDMSTDRGYLDIGYGLFSGCSSLRRVIFPRDFYMFSSGMPQSRVPLFQNCDSIEEIVFLGRVQNGVLNNLGISLNNRLRFTANFEKQWKIYVEDYNVTGWAIWDEFKRDEEPIDSGDDKDALDAPDYSLADYTSEDPRMDSLVKLSDKFNEALKTVEAAYEKSYAGLVRQRKEMLRKYREKAQQEGDLDTVIIFGKAMESEDPIETDNKVLLAIFSKFSTDVEEQERARDMKCVKLVDLLCTQIEHIKVQETKAGNFELAKEAKSYEERVKKLYDSLRHHSVGSEKGDATGNSTSSPSGSTRPQARPASAPDSGANPSPSGLFSVPGAMTYRLFVAANDEKGTLIGGGNFEKGDLLVIQYVGGEMSRYKGSSYSTNPDKQDSYYYYDSEYARSRTHSFVKVEGPAGSRTKVSRQLPYGTAQSPYVFEVPESGRYRLIGFLNSSGDGKVSYQVLRVTKFNSQSFRNSPLAKKCQW